MDASPIVLFILPSMRISGGVLETMRLAGELRSHGIDARILSLWKHPILVEPNDIADISGVPIEYLSQLNASKLRAPFDLLVFMPLYWRYLGRLKDQAGHTIPTVVLTHYATLPFAWFTPWSRRYSFMQDEEWLFLSKGLGRQILRKFILFTYTRCQVITSNPYLTERVRLEGIAPAAEAFIWAAPEFGVGPLAENRSLDVVMVLRHGYHKRLDLYMKLLADARNYSFSCAVVTSEDDIAAEASKLANVCLLRPSVEEMKGLFRRTKVFVLLSEREGFGLPPLEAMGSGCVPLCRDSGGVRCYMTGALAGNLIPLDAPFASIFQRLKDLLADPEKLLQLSEEARRIFMEGAGEAFEKRERALTLLAGK